MDIAPTSRKYFSGNVLLLIIPLINNASIVERVVVITWQGEYTSKIALSFKRDFYHASCGEGRGGNASRRHSLFLASGTG